MRKDSDDSTTTTTKCVPFASQSPSSTRYPQHVGIPFAQIAYFLSIGKMKNKSNARFAGRTSACSLSYLKAAMRRHVWRSNSNNTTVCLTIIGL